MKKFWILLCLACFACIPLSGCSEVAAFLGGIGASESVEQLVNNAEAQKVRLEGELEEQALLVEAALSKNEQLLTDLDNASTNAEREVIQSEVDIARVELNAARGDLFTTKNKLVYNEGFLNASGAVQEGMSKDWKSGTPTNLGELAIFGITTGVGIYGWLQRKKKLDAEGMYVQADTALIETVKAIDNFKRADSTGNTELNNALRDTQSAQSKLLVNEILVT